MEVYNPKVYAMVNAVGVDAEINTLQQRLKALTFIHSIFGRTTSQLKVLKDTEVDNRFAANKQKLAGRFNEYYPMGMKGKEMVNLMPSDSYPSYIFFSVKDPMTPSGPTKYTGSTGDDDMDRQIVVTTGVNVIFWCKLDQLDKAATHLWGEMLKRDIIGALHKAYRFKFVNAFETYDQVLKDYTVNETYRQYCKFPYYGLRIEGTLSFPLFPENQ